MKKTTRRKIGGAALAVGGAGLALGTPAVSRAELKIASVRTAGIDRKLAQAKASMPKRPDPATRRYAGRYGPEKQKTKFARQQEKKKVSGQIDELNRKRKDVNRPRLYHKQTKLWGASLGVGVPTSYVGARHTVSKKMRRSDVAAAYVGGTGAFVGYQGGSLAMKPLEKPAEKKIKANPDLQRKLVAHRAKTLPKNASAGHPSWGEYNRSYPKDLPGARMKRITAHAVSGKSGGLATLGAVAAGAAGGVALHRRHKVKKSVSPFGIEH